ncbi:hypothetical protein AKO1_008056 [Acrasis kona]|uniref:Pyroglutamyl-peptidase I n=1 Tax=Acrasis kona TaxID=1008807 RepID=A0AAW2YPT1_9EUKA
MTEVHLTGFGPFHNVPENPSKLLAEYYADHLKEHGLTSSTVIEVSTEGVEVYLKNMKEQLLTRINSESFKDKKIILLHYGVSASSKRYEIETRGKNEASFRAPDQRGHQPTLLPIDSLHPIEHWRSTTIPVNLITQNVNQTLSQESSGHKPLSTFSPVKVIQATKDPLPFGQVVENVEEEKESENLFLFESNNAGLFLCNYLYYASLKMCEELNSIPNSNFNLKSVFVHIPSHNTISFDQQRIFSDTLLRELVKN